MLDLQGMGEGRGNAARTRWSAQEDGRTARLATTNMHRHHPLT